MAVLTAEQADHLNGPNTVYVATHDGSLVPHVTPALALRCQAGTDRVTVWLPRSVAGACEQDLRVESRVALVCNRPSTHRAWQLKGRVASLLAAPDDRRPLTEEAFQELVAECERVGLPRRIIDRVVRWPLLEVEVVVSELFDQTPGPGAGERFAGAPCR